MSVERQIQTVLLDMGGVILQMAGGHGFPHSRLDYRGRQALLRAIGRNRSGVTLEDLGSVLFDPWVRDYEKREETGVEANWTPHLDRLRQRWSVEQSDVQLLETWFRPYGEQLIPIEGVGEVLQELRASGLRLALVSNVPLPGELYAAVLERYGLAAAFETLCFSYDHGTRKPSPALLRLALKTTGSDAAAAVMVGDRRERDIAAGRFAGTRTVWIRGADEGGPAADATLDGLSGLPELLRSWQR